MTSWIRIRIRIQSSWIRIRIQENRGGFGFSWIRIQGALIRIRIRIRDAWIRTSLVEMLKSGTLKTVMDIISLDDLQ